MSGSWWLVPLCLAKLLTVVPPSSTHGSALLTALTLGLRDDLVKGVLLRVFVERIDERGFKISKLFLQCLLELQSRLVVRIEILIITLLETFDSI